MLVKRGSWWVKNPIDSKLSISVPSVIIWLSEDIERNSGKGVRFDIAFKGKYCLTAGSKKLLKTGSIRIRSKKNITIDSPVPFIRIAITNPTTI